MKHHAEGHLIITDKATGEKLVDQKNAIHFGNISWAIANALAGDAIGHISNMVFGSGGTSIDSSGNISYRSPNTSNLQDPAAEPYQPTYWQDLTAAGNSISSVAGTSNFADLQSIATLSFGEPDNVNPEFLQSSIDTAATTNGTYVFDEVDAGVGGKAAIEVGRRLHALSQHAQVIVVTHLPQVAAWADSHFVVTKNSDGSVTESNVRKVVKEDRVEEIARMLAGLENSSSAREHATELLSLKV